MAGKCEEHDNNKMTNWWQNTAATSTPGMEIVEYHRVHTTVTHPIESNCSKFSDFKSIFNFATFTKEENFPTTYLVSTFKNKIVL